MLAYILCKKRRKWVIYTLPLKLLCNYWKFVFSCFCSTKLLRSSEQERSFFDIKVNSKFIIGMLKLRDIISLSKMHEDTYIHGTSAREILFLTELVGFLIMFLLILFSSICTIFHKWTLLVWWLTIGFRCSLNQDKSREAIPPYNVLFH